MADDGNQERSEKATPFKLREARRQGQVAKSPELTGAVILVGAASFFYSAGLPWLERNLRLAAALFDQSGTIALSTFTAVQLYIRASTHLLSLLWPLAAAIVGLGLLANFVQTGPVFSTKPLQVDFKRLDPVAGFKRMFSKKILFELLKTLLKVGLLLAVVTTFLRQQLHALAGLLDMDLRATPGPVLDISIRLTFWMLAALGVVALLDFGLQKWDYQRNLRMSRRDIKEEVKQHDGDPQIKARIRELQREAARRSGSTGRVADADVLITNPTHLSVAIQYRHGHTAAPVVLSKGAGDLALQMRLLARRHGVPIVEDKPLARMLFERVDIDALITPECYAGVAAILTRVYRERERH